LESPRRHAFFYVWFLRSHGSVLTLVALANARVVIVSPIVATTPLFGLTISLIFLRGKEQVTGHTIIGTVAVVLETIAIVLGK